MSKYAVSKCGSYEEFRFEFETVEDRDEWYEEIEFMRAHDWGYEILRVVKGMYITYGERVLDDSKALFVVCNHHAMLYIKILIECVGDITETDEI